MIGYLDGTLQKQDEKAIIINVSGVGYRILPSAGLLRKPPSVGDKVELFVFTYVRDDQITLYGFSTPDEQAIFESLLSVSGIGPKSALAVVSAGGPEEVKNAVATADVQFFQSIPGIGKKSAQRIIVDLKSKLGDLEELDLTAQDKKLHRELIAALKSMGFQLNEVKDVVKSIDPTLKLEDQIRSALKNISS